jgi:uncharacterized membrane protein HdeD (DUF308 family)
VNSAVSVRHGEGWSIFVGIVLIVVGLASIAVPFLAGVAGAIFFGWLILFGGIAHFVYAWSERGAGAGIVLWQILIGIVYLIAATYILLLPIGGIIALTFALACYITLEGILEIMLFIKLRALAGTAWFLIDGIISLLLAGLILLHWPSSSLWALGTLLGVSLLISGIARLTMPVARRRIAIAI